MLYEPETRYLLQERLILLASKKKQKHLTFLDMYLDSPRSCAEQHSDSLEEVAWV